MKIYLKQMSMVAITAPVILQPPPLPPSLRPLGPRNFKMINCNKRPHYINLPQTGRTRRLVIQLRPKVQDMSTGQQYPAILIIIPDFISRPARQPQPPEVIGLGPRHPVWLPVKLKAKWLVTTRPMRRQPWPKERRLRPIIMVQLVCIMPPLVIFHITIRI